MVITLKMCLETEYIVVVVVDRFYIALFSALEQTHCALFAMWFRIRK